MTRQPKQPCLATTYAYDATIPCARPAGHGKSVKNSREWTWGDGHCQTAFPTDPPTFRPEPYTAFRAGTTVSRSS